ETKNDEIKPQPPAPTADPETEPRLAKLLKQNEDQGLNRRRKELEKLGETPVTAPEVETPVEPKPSTEQVKKAAEAAEKKAADDKKAARIAELREAQGGILKRMSDQSLLRACVDNPALGSGMSERLALINRELDMLEGRVAVSTQFGDIVYEQRRDNAESQREYQQEYNYQRSGGQITPPSSLLPDYIIARRFKKGGE